MRKCLVHGPDTVRRYAEVIDPKAHEQRRKQRICSRFAAHRHWPVMLTRCPTHITY